MAGTKKKQIVITVSGDRSIHEVAADLKKEGLDLDQVLDAVGSITGSAAPESFGRLRKVRGVADVSLDHPVDIGPPGAPVS
jgi:hypothetical protein